MERKERKKKEEKTIMWWAQKLSGNYVKIEDYSKGIL